MDTTKLRLKVAQLLLPELKEGIRRWFYISIAEEKGFFGGVFIMAHGPTDAWRILHTLNILSSGADVSTETHELDDGTIERVPESMRWRRLTREEIETLS